MGVLLAGYWQHNLDPFAIKFPEGFFIPGIRWYGLAYLAGFLAGWYLLRKLAQRGRLGGVHPIEVGDLVFWLAVGAVLGGRIGYAFLYNFQVTVSQPWTLLQVWQGGMASHGGIVGVTLAAIWWWSRRPISAEESVLGAAPAPDPGEMDEHGRIRTDTEARSRIPGGNIHHRGTARQSRNQREDVTAENAKSAETREKSSQDGEISEDSSTETQRKSSQEATNREESSADSDDKDDAPGATTRVESDGETHSPESRMTAPRARKRRSGGGRGGNRGAAPHGNSKAGDTGGDAAAPRYLEGSFLSRWDQTLRMAAFWRMGDGVVAVTPLGLFFGRVANFINGELWGRPSELPWAVVFPDSPPPLTPRHPSALYEAALEGIFLFLWLFPGAWRARWRPGGAVARFIIGYAAVRFLVEFFREPDVGIGYEWLNFTRGQWLSAVMAAGGLVLLAWLAPLARKSR